MLCNVYTLRESRCAVRVYRVETGVTLHACVSGKQTCHQLRKNPPPLPLPAYKSLAGGSKINRPAWQTNRTASSIRL